VALAAAGRLEPSAILIEVQLPDGDGVALAGELTVLPWRPHVVLTSSNADITTSEEVRNAGARAFVQKSDPPYAPWSQLLGGD
jgi:DNA-binding NarL/FixJ family response regulator